MAASNSYEVRCENCNTSFPPETKRCIHCGGPLGSRLGGLLAGSRAPDASGGEEEDDQEVPFQRGRNVIWIVTALIALVLSALRTCAER